MKNRIAITAMAAICPLGQNLEEIEAQLFAGQSGIKDIRGQRVHDDFPVPHAGVIDYESLPHLETKLPNDLATSGRLAALCLEQILKQRKSHFDGMVFGTADGYQFNLVQDATNKVLDSNAHASAQPEFVMNVLNQVLVHHGLNAVPEIHQISVNSACASSNQALGIALRRLRHGQWKKALVGGVDTRICASNLMNFHLLGAVNSEEGESAQASRPFSSDRNGFVRGESSALLVLETEESAKFRNADIIGYLDGYATSTDAYRVTDGRKDTLGVRQAMSQAISDAGIQVDDIDAISAHGTATALNDKLESQAIEKLFGERAFKIPCTSLKSQVGHPTVAAGALEAISCLLMLKRQKVAPTINFNVQERDSECRLDYVPNQSREAEIQHLLNNSFAFGGQNAVTVFSAH